MAEPTLYLFDGHNLYHAGGYEDARRLRDELASFVAAPAAGAVRALAVIPGDRALPTGSRDR